MLAHAWAIRYPSVGGGERLRMGAGAATGVERGLWGWGTEARVGSVGS